MDTGAIAGMAMSMQTQQLQQAVGTSIMKKSMDATQESAAALVEMMKTNTQAMESSVNPHLGGRLNVLA